MSKLTLSFKNKILRVYPVQQGVMEIGSDEKCQIHIDSLAVQPHHARIETHGSDSLLFDQETEDGTFVNQKRITEHKLKDGDFIRVGKHTLQYAYEEVTQLDANESSTSIDIHPVINEVAAKTEAAKTAEPEPDEPETFVSQTIKQGWLQILNGQNLGKTLSLNRSMTNLGKPGVATAVITKRNDGYFISHLEGKYPPSVGEESIGDRSIKLQDGDTITIGNIKMQFYME